MLMQHIMKYIFVIIFVIFISKISSSKDLFDTSFYEVEFISNNIENEKIRKINEIKQQSILKVFQKTLNYENLNLVKKDLSSDIINTFIKNIIINDEKIINDKYFSNIKINFDKKKIIDYYRYLKIPYVEYYPKKFLLIIYEENGISKNLLSINNKFYFYLKNQSKNFDLFKIPNLDINDRFLLKKEDILNNDFKKINEFAKKYKINEIIITKIKRNKDKSNYELILSSNNKIFKKNLTFDTNDIETFFEILNDEALNIWKKINQIQNNILHNITCNIKYYNFYELKELRKSLYKISIINNLNIQSISYKNVEYRIYYYGNIKILKNLFNYYNLKFNNFNNVCTISLK